MSRTRSSSRSNAAKEHVHNDVLDVVARLASKLTTDRYGHDKGVIVKVCGSTLLGMMTERDVGETDIDLEELTRRCIVDISKEKKRRELLETRFCYAVLLGLGLLFSIVFLYHGMYFANK